MRTEMENELEQAIHRVKQEASLHPEYNAAVDLIIQHAIEGERWKKRMLVLERRLREIVDWATGKRDGKEGKDASDAADVRWELCEALFEVVWVYDESPYRTVDAEGVVTGEKWLAKELAAVLERHDDLLNRLDVQGYLHQRRLAGDEPTER